MRRALIAVLASLLIASFIAPVAAAAPAQSGAVPKVVVVVGPSGAATTRYRTEARAAATARTPLHPGCHRDLLAQRHVAGGQERVAGCQPRHLHGPRQRLAEPVPQQPLPADPERLRAEPEPRRQRRHASVLRGGADRLGRPPGEERGRAPEPPLLRVGQQRAGRPRGHAEHVAPARRTTSLPASSRRAPPPWSQRRTPARTTWSGPCSPGSARSRRPGVAHPQRNGNAFAFESSRSKGYVVQMDPERNNSGFSRSIVLKKGLASSDVLRNARGSALSAAAAAVSRDRSGPRPDPGRQRDRDRRPQLPGLDRGGWQDQLPDPVQDR